MRKAPVRIEPLAKKVGDRSYHRIGTHDSSIAAGRNGAKRLIFGSIRFCLEEMASSQQNVATVKPMPPNELTTMTQ
jgi:hypothetical protein